jgi:hypothetical protein
VLPLRGNHPLKEQLEGRPTISISCGNGKKEEATNDVIILLKNAHSDHFGSKHYKEFYPFQPTHL